MNNIEVKKHIEVALMIELFKKFKAPGVNKEDCIEILYNELESRGYNKSTDSFE